MRTGAEIFGS